MDEIVSSLKHPAVRAARQALAKPTAFLAEGSRFVTQARDARALLHGLFFLHPVASGSAEARLLERATQDGTEHYVVSKGVFSRLLGLSYATAARVLAVVAIPALSLEDVLRQVDKDCCALVGEGIQDPRNVGTLVRTADAWGLNLALFSADSADPFSRAAVRASTGSLFRVPVVKTEDLPRALRQLQARGLRVIGSSAQAAEVCWQATLTPPCAVVLGNETSGLSEAVKAVCDQMVAVPMTGGAHSLNVAVAGGILLYEIMRQEAHAHHSG